MATKRRRSRSSWGAKRKLPSGRWQASYIGPDALRHTAPHTFDADVDATAWLIRERELIVHDRWTPPTRRQQPAPLTFAAYANRWLERRTVRGQALKPSTQALYRTLLDKLIEPTFGTQGVTSITREEVTAWHASLDATTPTRRAHAYSLLRTVLNDAVDEGLIPANPCRIKGAGRAERKREITPASLDELDTIVKNMPDHLEAMVLLASWCALRFGELAELRRRDIDLKSREVQISRAVTWVQGEAIVGPPKTAHGVRVVAIPPHIIPALTLHLRDYTSRGRDALLFPARNGMQLTPSELYRDYFPARAAAHRPDLRWHDLRHTGATNAARAGATVAELQARLGHSTPNMAMRYQHAARGRDRAIADAMSAAATLDTMTSADTPNNV